MLSNCCVVFVCLLAWMKDVGGGVKSMSDKRKSECWKNVHDGVGNCLHQSQHPLNP